MSKETKIHGKQTSQGAGFASKARHTTETLGAASTWSEVKDGGSDYIGRPSLSRLLDHPEGNRCAPCEMR